MTRRFLFGLVSVRNWGYRCELTMPQIELMSSDLPHTLYLRTDKKGRVIQPPSDGDDESVRLNQMLLDKRKAKEVTVEQLFDEAKNENE